MLPAWSLYTLLSSNAFFLSESPWREPTTLASLPTSFFTLLVAATHPLLFVAGCSDAAYEERKQHELYCDMVSIWEADEAKGIRAEERSGWPPYKGECK